MNLNRKRLTRANKIAAKYFLQSLKESKLAQKSVYDRISKETAKMYHIGCAPNSGLIDWLNDYEVSEEEAECVGLIKLNEDGLAREVFTDRIIIPIIYAGWIVGFGGRSIRKSKRDKYINSKASPLYNKSDVLFGLWFSRQHILSKGCAIVVEGYFDFLSLVDNDIKNTVATCGTSLTENHVLALSRYTNKVCIMTDGDRAGKKAAKKMETMIDSKGLESQIAELPNKLDPEDFVKTRGRKKLVKLVKYYMEDQ